MESLRVGPQVSESAPDLSGRPSGGQEYTAE